MRHIEIMSRRHAEPKSVLLDPSTTSSKSSKSDEGRDEKNTLAFKVSHILVSILFLWFLYVPSPQDPLQGTDQVSVLYNSWDFSSSAKASS